MIRLALLSCVLALFLIGCNDPISSNDNNTTDTTIKKDSIPHNPAVNPFLGKWIQFIDSTDDGTFPIELKREAFNAQFIVDDTLGNGHWEWPQPDWYVFESDSILRNDDSKHRYYFAKDSLYYVWYGNSGVHSHDSVYINSCAYIISGDTLLWGGLPDPDYPATNKFIKVK